MVIILDKHKKPMGFTTEEHARRLMGKGRACVYKTFPFTIILKDRDARLLNDIPTFRIKIDPGSIHTGIAIVGNCDNKVYFYMQIDHRASEIKEALDTRSESRRNRRERECWYRRPKWGNKPKKKGKKPHYDSPRPDGWLPPSEQSIVDGILTWVKRLKKLIPVTECSFEAVRFDSQLLDNPDIEGIEYQHGTLYGTEIREYLLEKYQHVCQYCGGESKDTVLEWEHKIPKSRGGSDKVSNATLSCSCCNREKSSRKPEEWLEDIKAKKRKTKFDRKRLECIENVINDTKNGQSSRYSAWVTAIRRQVEKGLFGIFGNVECSSGGRTKFNRNRLKLPKDHHYDALCVGTVPDKGYEDLTGGYYLHAEAKGRGTRLRGQLNSCGIIIVKYKDRTKQKFGFQTGDIVSAHVKKGKYAGSHTGRVMVRSSGNFDIRCVNGKLATANYKDCRILQKNDGYQYSIKRGAIPPGS